MDIISIIENCDGLEQLVEIIKKNKIKLSKDEWFKIFEINDKLNQLCFEYVEKLPITEDGVLKIYNLERNLRFIIKCYCLTQNIEVDMFIEDDGYIIDTEKQIIKEIFKYPVLSDEEQKELLLRYKNGDMQAKEKLLKSNMRLVLKEANKNLTSDSDFLDLFQEGCIGLMKAIENFDLNYGTKLSTYAKPKIDVEIQAYKKRKMKMVRIPDYKQEIIYKFYNVKNKLQQKYKRTVSDNEVADYMNLTSEEKLLLPVLLNIPKSLDKPIDKTDETSDATMLDMVEDTKNKSVEDQIINQELKEVLEKVMNEKLTEKQKQIISYRYGLIDGRCYKYEELGSEFGMSRQGAQQTERSALVKLKQSKDLKNLL